MKTLNDLGTVLFVILLLVLVSPILIVLILISVPYSIIHGFFYRRKRTREFKDALEFNNGKIFFLYGEYHEFDFLTYFETHHSEISCLQVPNNYIDDLFIDHLMENGKPKSLPKLVKIDKGNLIKKEHYNSFKHYIRRNKNPDSFFELIESSIKNLEKI